MDINFFEKFPTEKNLNKVSLIRFPSLLFIAAKNLEEFRKYEKYVRKLNKKIEVGYWPVLSKDEGYWMSPFSSRQGLERIINELDKEKKKLTLLWDCEFPVNKKRLFLPTKRFFTNKNMITKFLRNTKHNVYIVQYPIVTLFGDLFKFYGLDFPFINKKIYMTYTSMVRKPVKRIYRNIIRMSSRVALGTIAKGALGNEPILTPKDLDSDLKLAKDTNTKEVFIYRLGGLNQRYIKVIENYIS